MGSLCTSYEGTVNLRKIEMVELEKLIGFISGESYGNRPFEFSEQFIIFNFEDVDNDTFCWDYMMSRSNVEAKCLKDFLFLLNARRALSLTYLSECRSTDGWDEEKPHLDFEELAERLPTLVLQEVLAKRLETSV